MAFLDHRPVFKGHVLVCPVLHVDTFTDLPAHLVAPLFIVVQSVPHLHVHVVPRTKGDGLRGFFWPRTRYADGEAAECAARLREALAPAPGALDG